MQKHLDAGDEVVQLVCNSGLKSCDINLEHKFSKCMQCISKRKYGLSLLNGEVREIELLSLVTQGDREKIQSIPKMFRDIEELQAFEYEAFPIGYAVGSTLISLFKDPKLSLQDHRELLEDTIDSSLAVYLSMQHILDLEKPDRVYVFNGRFARTRAVFSACKKAGVDCFMHERGSRPGLYELFQNHLPHDISRFHENVMNWWNNYPAEQRESTAESFFNDRQMGKSDRWYSFTANQSDNLMPRGWDQNKKNIVIFNSSEDEFASCGDEWKIKLYDSQDEGIRQIARSLENHEEYALYLRIHPHLKHKPQPLSYLEKAIAGEKIHIIPPDSPVDTYALIEKADKVISFGSTAGIEATFAGKPSILLGSAFYEHMDAVYKPQSHEELLELLFSDLPAKPRENALPFGLYMKTHGKEHVHYKTKTFDNGYFKGQRVRAFAETDRWKVLDSLFSMGIPVVSEMVHRGFLKKINY